MRSQSVVQDSIFAMAAVKRVADSIAGRGSARSVRTALPAPTAVSVVPAVPIPRGQAIGDSIAQELASKMASQNRGAGGGDTLRGIVQLQGKAPMSRAVLTTDKGSTVITLTGMGTDGLGQLQGSEVVVRGLRVGPRDIVVSSFSVRAVNGIPAIDGRLLKAQGGWAVQLSDNSGIRKLVGVPPALEAFEGSRVWIADEPGAPKLYGLIVRR